MLQYPLFGLIQDILKLSQANYTVIVSKWFTHDFYDSTISKYDFSKNYANNS